MVSASNAWALRPLVPASVTASSTAAGYAASNVMLDYSGVVWKSNTGGASQSVTFDMGAGVTAAPDSALFFGCTAAAAPWTLTIEGADDAAITINVVTAATTVPFLAGATFPSHGRGVGYWAGTATAARRYWRFTIGSLATAAVTIARIAIGTRIQLDRNFAFAGVFGVRDFGSVDWAASGILLRRRAAKLRTLSITFPNVRKDEVETKVQPLIEWAGGQEAIVIVTDPTVDTQRQTRCWFGVLVGDLGTIWRGPLAWEWRASLVDLIAIPKSA